MARRESRRPVAKVAKSLVLASMLPSTTIKGAMMDDDRARELLAAERLRIEGLLRDMTEEREADRTAANQEGDMFDSAEPLTEQGTDDSVVVELRQRLEAIARAEQRLAAGTYGCSIQSGTPIPDERLEADPAAELTVEEAQANFVVRPAFLCRTRRCEADRSLAVIAATIQTKEGGVGRVVISEFQLRSEVAGDLLVAGSAQLARTLVQHGLIDEMRLMTFPIVLGSGKKLFGEIGHPTTFILAATQATASGIVMLRYQEASATAGRKDFENA